MFDQVYPSGMGDHEKAKCRSFWHAVHEEFMSVFVKKFDFYHQKWLHTPAAKAYKEEVAALKCYCSSSEPADFCVEGPGSKLVLSTLKVSLAIKTLPANNILESKIGGSLLSMTSSALCPKSPTLVWLR